MEVSSVPLEADLVPESLIRAVDQKGRVTLTHNVTLHDDTHPLEARVHYHLHPSDPARSRVSFSISSEYEDLIVRSDRPLQAIAENGTTGRIIEMFNPSDPQKAHPRYVQLARLSQSLWSPEADVPHSEVASFTMTETDGYALIDMIKGQTVAEKKPERHVSGHIVRDAVVTLYRKLR